jgi:hypothetical protein
MTNDGLASLSPFLFINHNTNILKKIGVRYYPFPRLLLRPHAFSITNITLKLNFIKILKGVLPGAGDKLTGG